MSVRNSHLELARLAGVLAHPSSRSTVRHGVVTGVDNDRLIVGFGNDEPVRVLAATGKYPIGATVAVVTDSAGRPRYAAGVATLPARVDGASAPVEVVDVHRELSPREFTDEERAEFQRFRDELASGQEVLTQAQAQADKDLAELDTRLASAQAQTQQDLAELDTRVTVMSNKRHITVSTSTPSGTGSTPDAVWWKVNSAYEIVGQWAWNGSSWRETPIRDEVIASLDVAKLRVVGTSTFTEAVAQKIFTDIVVARTLTANQAFIGGTVLKDDAIQARHLNVIPDSTTGGTVLDGVNLGMQGPDNGEAVSQFLITVDPAKTDSITLAKDGVVTFSVSPDGAMVAQDVTANQSLTYQGVELSTWLNMLPQGNVSGTVTYPTANMTLDGTERTLMLCSVPERDSSLGMRHYVVHAQVDAGYSGKTVGLRLRYTADGTAVKTTSSSIASTIIVASGVAQFSCHVVASAEKNLNFRLGAWSSGGAVLNGGTQATHMWVEDAGLVPDNGLLLGRAPAQGNQTVVEDTTPTLQTYTRTFAPTWWQSYKSSGAQYTSYPKYVHHGQYLSSFGVLGSLIGFDSTAIRSFIGSGTVTRVDIYLKNVHSYANSGMTAYYSTHGQASKPSSYSVPAAGNTRFFKKGEGAWITLPSTMWESWKTGSAKGISLKPSSSSLAYYGYFDPSVARVKIWVKR